MNISEATDCSGRSSSTKAAHVLGKYLLSFPLGLSPLTLLMGGILYFLPDKVLCREEAVGKIIEKIEKDPLIEWSIICGDRVCVAGEISADFFIKKNLSFLAMYIIL